MPRCLRLFGWSSLLAGAFACASRAGGPPSGEVGPSTEQTLDELFNLATVYQRLGRIAAGGPMPFVGTAAFFAGQGDSVIARIGLSFANHAFAFTREGRSYVARFRVEYQLARTGQAPIQAVRDELVRVDSFSETQRNDESVIVEQGFLLVSGSYTLSVTVRDPAANVSSRGEQVLEVPAFPAGSFTPPIFVYEARPRRALTDSVVLLLNPRGTVANGGGDSLLMYIEGYRQPGARQVPVIVRDDRDSLLYQVNIPFQGDRPVEGYLLRIAPDAPPLGQLRITVGEGSEARRVTALVSFSRSWVVTDYDNLLTLLRWFPWAPDRLNALRNARPADRTRLWREFWVATDRNPHTPENEVLDQYFSRIAIANERFRDEAGPGWRSERGEVYVTLGEPDQIFENALASDQRIIQWIYNHYRANIVFTGPLGFSRLRITPESRAEFNRARAEVIRQGPPG
ncbi:MAG: GWxTD domain-containing protein [Gemmatimonadales bacterium]